MGPRMARGGTGGVYRAVDQRLDRTVAVKIMHPHLTEDPAFVGRFAREARAAAQLSHPHVVAVLDQGETPDGLVYLVMEYVEGGTLRDVLHRKGFLTPSQAFSILAQMLDGLASAHRAGLVHRDIKPENVLMRTDGTVKVADFGLSRGADQHTTTGAVLGTVAYAAPELVLEKPVGTRADVYSVGILAWEMLAGRRPFEGGPLSLARAHAEQAVPALEKTVDGIDPLIAQMLARWTAKEEDQRPADASHLVQELAHVRRQLNADALTHVPNGWEQGPGPLAPVVADPGASVLPPTAPATGPVEERRSSGSLPTAPADASEFSESAEAPTEAVAPVTPRADDDSTRAKRPFPQTAQSTQTAQGTQATPSQAEAPTEAITTATAHASTRTAPKNLGVFDDTTSLTGLHTATSPTVSEEGLGTGGTGRGGGSTASSVWYDDGGAAGSGSATLSGHATPYGRTAQSGRATKSGRTEPTDPTKPMVKLIRWSVLKVGVALALTVLLVCLAAFMGWLLGSGSFRTEVVPAVYGTSTEQAQSLVQDQGFGNVRVYEQSSTELPAGSVLGTEPAEGTQMRVGEQLSILVSSGPARVSVPALEGLEQQEATSRLENAGLSPGQITTEFSSSAEGTVIAASPTQSTQVDEGSSVDLTISAGSEPTEVPNVVGSDVTDATSQLEDLGFTVTREDVAGGRLGRVITQSQNGTNITLRVI